MKKTTGLCLFVFVLFQFGLAQQKKADIIGEQITRNLEIACEYIDNDNDSARLYIQKAKDLSKKTKQPLYEVKILETEGNYFGFVKNDYNNATNLYLKAIGICEKKKLDYTKNLYHSLGVLFHLTDNYEKAKLYYNKAIPLEKKAKDSLLLARSLANLASINSSQEHFSKAEELFLESLKYPSSFEIKRTTYANLGNLKIREKKFDQALAYLKKVIVKNPETGEGPDEIDYSYLLDAKTGARDFSGTDTIIPHAIKLYKTTPDLRDKSILLRALGNLYHAMGQYDKASVAKDEYILIYDSLKAKQRDETVYEMETKYQTEKKEAEIIKQEKEKNKLQLLMILACFTIALLGYLVYQNLKQKNKLKKQTALLETAVDEKNILLKETHHRVKNSFQIVSSLLYLQSENMKDKEAALAVKEAQNRVKSMVLIHQKLYSKDQLIGIETREYIEDLVNDIIENQTGTIANLTTSLRVESTVFSIDSITPLGLIINELITNCIKHAFPAAVENPKIELEFYKQGEIYVLKVSDNGIGFKNEISENSFGIKLINALAKKLKGKISFENNNGTHFVMEIHKLSVLPKSENAKH